VKYSFSFLSAALVVMSAMVVRGGDE
jgi:hypothetical protein